MSTSSVQSLLSKREEERTTSSGNHSSPAPVETNSDNVETTEQSIDKRLDLATDFVQESALKLSSGGTDEGKDRTTSSENHTSPAPPERNCKRDCNVRKTDNVETADQSINRTLAEVTDYVQESALKLSSIVDGLDQTMSEPQNGSPKSATGVTEEVVYQLDKKEPEHSANPDSGSPTGQGLYVVENPEDCLLEQGLSPPSEVRKSGKEPAFELVKTIRDCDEKGDFCPEDLAMSATGGKKAASIQGSNSCGFQHTSTISGVVAGGPSSGDKEASLAVGRAERLDLDLNLPAVEESFVYDDQQPEYGVDPTQNQQLCGENAPVERGEGNAQSSEMAMKRGEPSDGFDLYPESRKRL